METATRVPTTITYANSVESSNSSTKANRNHRSGTCAKEQYQSLERKYVELKFEHAQLQANPDLRRRRKAEMDREIKHLQQRIPELAKEIEETKIKLDKQKETLNQLTGDLETMAIDQERACINAYNIQTDHGIEKSNQESTSSEANELREHHKSLVNNIESLKEEAKKISSEHALNELKSKKIVSTNEKIKKEFNELTASIDDYKNRINNAIKERDNYIQETKKIEKQNSVFAKRLRRRQGTNFRDLQDRVSFLRMSKYQQDDLRMSKSQVGHQSNDMDSSTNTL